MNRYMELKFQVECLQDLAVVRCSGRMVRGASLDQFRRRIEQLMEQLGRVRVLVLDVKISSRMLAGFGGRQVLGTHGAWGIARPVPAPDRTANGTTRTCPRAGAGCFGSRATGCGRLGNLAAGAPLGGAEIGEGKAGEPAGFLPPAAGGHASHIDV